MKLGLSLAGLALLSLAPHLMAQGGTLDSAVERARLAFHGHDVPALVEGSDTVRLSIPGTATVVSLRPGQAQRLLEQYLGPSEERGLTLVGMRRLADDHAYAELERSYVVKGTSEERRERVILGFRWLGQTWCLREVRVTP